MNWYFKVLRDYFVFDGRASRKEYWTFLLCHVVVTVLLVIVSVALASGTEFGFPLFAVYIVGTFIPHVAVIARRLHDIGKSGGWYFIGWIPYVGPFILLVMLARQGEYGYNRFGHDPKTLDG